MTLQGRVLADRYELGPLLGTGGMASVYRATDRVLQRTVAVKVLGRPYDQDPDFVARFRQEARAAAGLSHPNIVAVFDSSSHADVHYIVMELVDGQTLAQTIASQGPLAPYAAAEIAVGVCQALAAAHAAGLVHRDIKPANVIVSRTGLVKVADFGIAEAAAAHTLTGSGALLGAAAYLSPEQVQSLPVDARSDLYALGCVLYELLAGVPPFVGGSPAAVASQHVTATPEPPSRRNPRVGADLDAVVMTALAKQPGRRYQTASAMGEDLERIVHGAAAGAVPPRHHAAGPPTERLAPAASLDPAPTVVVAARAARAAARRPGLSLWALLAGLGIVAVLAVALPWGLRDRDSPAVQGATQSTMTAAPPPTASPTSTTPTTTPKRPVPSPSVALAHLTAVITAGRRQGTAGHSAADLLRTAEEITRAVREGDADDVREKLAELEHKADELIDKGKIRPPTAGRVRQAIAQLATAIERAG